MEVGTRAEVPVGSREHCDVQCRISVELAEGVVEHVGCLKVDGVPDFGPVDCDDTDTADGVCGDFGLAHAPEATVAEMRDVLVERIGLWLEDPDSSVEYAEEVEGRWAVRMRQGVRDATTVWFDVGERSLWFEAYVLPAPPVAAEVHRQALTRNRSAWRAFFALDEEEAVVIRGRIAADRVTLEELDRALGEVYEMVELAFRPMVRAGFESRENSG